MRKEMHSRRDAFPQIPQVQPKPNTSTRSPRSPIQKPTNTVMKTKISYSLLAAAMACGLAQGQTTAYTTPVGYLTTPIFGNVSGGPAGAATLIAPTLLAPATFAGATNAAPAANTATFASPTVVPAGLDSTYFLEIADGPSEGWWSAVASSTATSVVVADTFPSGLAATTKVVVRKFNTISSVFGATNSSNLAPGDFIEILNPNLSITKIVYANGWFDENSEAPADNFAIEPGVAVRVIRAGTTGLSLVTSGEVKVTKTQVDLLQGETWVGQTFAANGTFGAMNLGPQILGTDKVEVYGVDGGTGQTVDVFVSAAGQMFNESSEAEADSFEVPDSSGVVIRRPAGTASTITIPAQVIGPVTP
jgi:hypothetical protein